MDKSVQQLIDEKMCRPGYVWNDTLKRCLSSGGGQSEIPEPDPVPEPVEPTTGGRGDVRVNANGITQTGTKMGKSIPLK